MTFTLPGTVLDFSLRGLLVAPFSVEKGEPVELVVSYIPEPDSVVCHLLWCSYFGLKDSWLTLRTRNHSWTVPLGSADFLDYILDHNSDYLKGDNVMFHGAAMTTMGFPGNLGQVATIDAGLRDHEQPYSMLDGIEIQDINLDGTIIGSVFIRSQASLSVYWEIICGVSTEPVTSP